MFLPEGAQNGGGELVNAGRVERLASLGELPLLNQGENSASGLRARAAGSRLQAVGLVKKFLPSAFSGLYQFLIQVLNRGEIGDLSFACPRREAEAELWEGVEQQPALLVVWLCLDLRKCLGENIYPGKACALWDALYCLEG